MSIYSIDGKGLATGLFLHNAFGKTSLTPRKSSPILFLRSSFLKKEKIIWDIGSFHESVRKTKYWYKGQDGFSQSPTRLLYRARKQRIRINCFIIWEKTLFTQEKIIIDSTRVLKNRLPDKKLTLDFEDSMMFKM